MLAGWFIVEPDEGHTDLLLFHLLFLQQYHPAKVSLSLVQGTKVVFYLDQPASFSIHHILVTSWEDKVHYLLIALWLQNKAHVEGAFESGDHQPIVRKDPPLVQVVCIFPTQKGYKRITYFGNCHPTGGEFLLSLDIELDPYQLLILILYGVL